MQTAPSVETKQNGRLQHFGFFMIGPLTAVILLLVLAATVLFSYQNQHQNRIFSGVTVLGQDLSGLSREEAQARLADAFPYPESAAITIADPATSQQWRLTPAALGMTLDAAATAQAAYDVGRSGDPLSRARELFESWYYGRTLAPLLTLDEAQFEQQMAGLAAEINRPPANAALNLENGTAQYLAGQNGRFLDVADARQRLLPALMQYREAELELLVHETQPAITDTGNASAQIQQLIGSSITFYLEAPLDELDLQPVMLSAQELSAWLRVEINEGPDGALQHHTFLDENAIRHWLRQFEKPLYRDPVNARFYFDDATEELVLVAPHVNGRELDIEATLAQLREKAGTANRSIPFAVQEIVPVAHSGATAAELGITELLSQSTTWFYGSSPARKHNIATSAANFYGIVIAPHEEFSFNKYQGSISEADGYESGLIIIGGLTIEGIGGGICQVSTTLYQTAFFAGYRITDRTPHGYMLGYYRDGAGHGMDATVYNDGVINVDMKFINNTEHHLLIENYYDTEHEALTFKFYSTNIGRRVEKELLPWQNVTPPVEEDTWVFRETLAPGTVEQVDWATEGADVMVTRIVYNIFGEPLYGEPEEFFRSHYIPVGNVYHYGPGVEPYDYSKVPDYP